MMFKLSHWTMRSRTLLLGLLPAVLMFTLIAGLFFWQRLNDAKVEVETVGKILSSQLVSSIEYPVISGNYELLKLLVSSAMEAPSVVKVSIEDTQGKVIYKNATPDYERINREDIEVYKRSLVQERSSYNEFSEFDDVNGKQPVMAPIAYVKVEVSYVLGRDRALIIAAKSMGWASSILLVCLLLARFMAESIARPIEKVSHSLSRIANGEFSSELEVTSGAEIGELQKGVNTMAKALKQSRDDQNQAIYDLEQSRKKAEEANDAKSDFLAIVSHELRTPINGAMGAIQLMSLPEEDVNREYLNIANRSLNNLLELVEDMLTLSSLEKMEQSLDQQAINIPSLLQHTLSDLQEKSQQNENELTLYLDDLCSNGLIKIDGIKFRQLVRHLLGNAIKFTRQGRIYCSIYVDQTSRGNVLRLDISDNGIGFPEEHKAAMFEAFKQEDCSLSREFDGLGIGLTICNDIINLMQGQLSIRDNSPRGTIVNCYMPIEVMANDRDLSEHNELQDLIAERKDRQSIRVLVVEDNRVNRIVAEKILKRLQLDTMSVESGVECVALYKTESFDLIFMDCQMPDMDGFETTKAIRAFEKLRNKAPVPIIALTANTSNNVREDCKSAGMSDYLAKPIKIEVLSEMVNRWLSTE